MPVVPASLPAPIGGWNTRDSLDAMPATDAVEMTNWIPQAGKIEVRSGYTSQITAVGSGDVEFMAEYHAGSTRKLLAAGNDNVIYDASGSAVSALASGFTNSQWDHVNFNGYMIMANGADTPQDYDGSTVSANGFTVSSGYATSSFDGITSYNNRLYLWDSGTQEFWYGGVGAISGSLTQFTLSRVTQLGGNLTAVGGLAMDSGDGYDDLICFIMSSGQVVIYAGTNPGDATAWTIKGVYDIGQPISKRAVARIGGDLLVATKDDYVSIKQVVSTGRVGQPSKLVGALKANLGQSATFGWQILPYYRESLIVMNVPQSDGTYDQHGINMETGGAFKWEGLNGVTWAVYNDELYFGGTNGTIWKYTGDNDNGGAIKANVQQAWSDFGSPTRKRIPAYRPVFRAAGNINYSSKVGFDFMNTIVSDASPSTAQTTPWGSPWGSPWSSASNTIQEWRANSGTGQKCATKINVNTLKPIEWHRTDFRIEQGRNL